MNIPISWLRLTKLCEIYEGSLSEELHRLKIRFNCKLSRTMAGNCTWGGSNDYVRSIIKLWKSIVITKIDFRVARKFDQSQICNPGKRVVVCVPPRLFKRACFHIVLLFIFLRLVEPRGKDMVPSLVINFIIINNKRSK